MGTIVGITEWYSRNNRPYIKTPPKAALHLHPRGMAVPALPVHNNGVLRGDDDLIRPPTAPPGLLQIMTIGWRHGPVRGGGRFTLRRRLMVDVPGRLVGIQKGRVVSARHVLIDVVVGDDVFLGPPVRLVGETHGGGVVPALGYARSTAAAAPVIGRAATQRVAAAALHAGGVGTRGRRNALLNEGLDEGVDHRHVGQDEADK